MVKPGPKSASNFPPIVVKGKDGKVQKLARGGEARYLLSVDAVLSVDPGAKVTAGDVLARIPLESAKTRDITGGLPRVAELFEARIPKDNAIIAKISGRIEFVRDYKAKRKIAIIPEEGEPIEYLIPKSRVIDVQEGDWVKKGDNLISGLIDSQITHEDGTKRPHTEDEIFGYAKLAIFAGGGTTWRATCGALVAAAREAMRIAAEPGFGQ